jgi:hypothetical protein
LRQPAVNQWSGTAFLFFKSYRDVGIGGQANLITFDFGYQSARNEVVMAFVAAHIFCFGKLDPITVDPVDRADMDTVSTDDFHMFPNVFKAAHRILLCDRVETNF